MSIVKTIFLGFAVGAGMSIPGLSGGTLAILLGIYYKLIYSVDNLLKDIKNNIQFLLFFALGGAIGFFTAAQLISRILSTAAAVPLRYAFLGAAAAAAIPVMREAKALPLSLSKLLLIIGGMVCAWLVTLLPAISLSESDVNGIVMQLLGGVLLAAALVLPGISGSQMLLTLGLYEQVMNSISDGKLLSLLPLVFGCLIGLLLTAKLMVRLLEHFDGTYLVILGFMLFSLRDMIPHSSSSMELTLGIVCAVIGFVIVFLILSAELDKTNSEIL